MESKKIKKTKRSVSSAKQVVSSLNLGTAPKAVVVNKEKKRKSTARVMATVMNCKVLSVAQSKDTHFEPKRLCVCSNDMPGGFIRSNHTYLVGWIEVQIHFIDFYRIMQHCTAPTTSTSETSFNVTSGLSSADSRCEGPGVVGPKGIQIHYKLHPLVRSSTKYIH